MFYAINQSINQSINKNANEKLGIEIIDIIQIKDNQFPIYKKLISNHSEQSIQVDSKEQYLLFLKTLPTLSVLIVEDTEGDHFYNVFKDYDGSMYIIDGDRQVYFKLNKEDDLVQKVPSWKEKDNFFSYSDDLEDNRANKKEEFDYFYCSTKVDLDKSYLLKIRVIKSTILIDNFSPPRKAEEEKKQQSSYWSDIF